MAHQTYYIVDSEFISCVFFVPSLKADLSVNLQDDSSFFYGVSSQYESSENMIITSSTKVCSFGKQVVEKVEVRQWENITNLFQFEC